MFTFEEGGWNTVWGQTLRGSFKKLCVQQYKDYPTLNPRVDSVHLSNRTRFEKYNEFVLLKFKNLNYES